MNEIGYGAEFSEDRKHRYALWRIWDVNKPKVMFIGLNPSTANENKNDPTIRRVCSLAKNLDYGGVYMMNLFTYVTANPSELDYNQDMTIANEWLVTISGLCKDIIFAWGNFNVYDRDFEVKKMFKNSLCLGKNKNGSPKHPLYIPNKTIPQLY